MSDNDIVLVVSPVDLSGKILGPIYNEREFAKTLSSNHPTLLLIGVSILRFHKRKDYLFKTFGHGSSQLKVVILPLFEVKYLVSLGYLFFSILSAIFFIGFHIGSGLRAAFVRTSTAASVLSIISKILNVPLTYRAISTPFNCFETGVFAFPSPIKKAYNLFMRAFDVTALSKSTYTSISSHGSRDLILSEVNISPEKIFFVPYNIPDFFINSIGQQKNFMPNEVRLAYFGSLNEYYSFNFLLRAIQELNIEGFNVRLVIYGTGPNCDSVFRAVENLNLQSKVSMFGVVPRENVPKVVEDIDASVIPYSDKLVKGVSLKSIESMALGVPVVISKHADPLYVNDENCIVLSEDSVTGWKIALRKLADSGFRKKLQEGGWQTAALFGKANILSTIELLLSKNKP